MIQNKKFDKNKSVLKEVYSKFSVNDPGELKELYMNVDQELMYAGKWNYNNSELITNKIKNAIEAVGIHAILDKKEKKWISGILWMWYHHAISCALFRYGDKKASIRYSATALDLQEEGHPNKITRLLYFLTRDDLNSAEQWFKSIKDEPEKTTANYSINLYKQGDFFKPQKKILSETI